MEKLVEKFMALGIGEKIIIIAGVVLFIDGFLPWYSASACGEVFGERICASASASGWGAPGAIWSILAVLVGLAMGAVVVVRGLTEAEIPDNVGGVSWPKILLGGGLATVLLVLIKLLNESSHLGFGFYLGILCVVALAVGGFLMFREEEAAAAA
jgi:hypothetical protein